jgi:hypothetical protein
VFQTAEGSVNSVLRLDVMSAYGRGISDLPHVMIRTQQKDVYVLVGRGRLGSSSVPAMNGEVTQQYYRLSQRY